MNKKVIAKELYGNACKHLRASVKNKSLFRSDAYELITSAAYLLLDFDSEKKMFIALAKECGVSTSVVSDAKICAKVEIEQSIEHNLWDADPLLEFHAHTTPKDRAKMLPVIKRLCKEKERNSPTKKMIAEIKEQYYGKAKPQPLVSERPKEDTRPDPVRAEPSHQVKKAEKNYDSDTSENSTKGGKKSQENNANNLTDKSYNVVELNPDLLIEKSVKYLCSKIDDDDLMKFSYALKVFSDEFLKSELYKIVNKPGIDEEALIKIANSISKVSKERKYQKSA